MTERILTTEEVADLHASGSGHMPMLKTSHELLRAERDALASQLNVLTIERDALLKFNEADKSLRAERDRLLAERERLVEFAWEHGRDERGYWEMTAAEVLAAFDAQQERT